jgi:hypothetical protein
MNDRFYHIMHKGLMAVLLAVLLSACSAIDEDLSDCGNEYELEYELQLVTNMQLELQTQLTTQAEATVATALQNHLKNIFSDFAHDIDLSFFEVDGKQERLYHEQHVMDDNEKSYSLYLPMREYRHLALANLQNNSWVTLTGDERSNSMALQQVVNEPVKSHQTGIFAARTNMDVMEDMSQTFHVNLYMVNCAAVLLLEARGHNANNVNVVSTGFATGYNVNDNSYTFSDSSPLVHADQVDVGTDSYLCYCTVTFPSSDQPNPKLSSAATANTYWQFLVYVKNADGTTTETILNIEEPLPAGQLKIIKGYIDTDGVVRTEAPNVGVSVTVDWNSGGNYEGEL